MARHVAVRSILDLSAAVCMGWEAPACGGPIEPERSFCRLFTGSGLAKSNASRSGQCICRMGKDSF